MKNKDLTRVALFTTLIIIGSYIRVPIPNIPFTLQFLFVALSGLLLGQKKATLSVVLYLIIGLSGLPVFATGGGIGYILKPSFGYLLGMVLGANLTGYLAQKKENPSVMWLFFSACMGMIPIYALGLVYGYYMTLFYLGNTIPLRTLLYSWCFIYLPGDIFSAYTAGVLCKRLHPFISAHPFKEAEEAPLP